MVDGEWLAELVGWVARSKTQLIRQYPGAVGLSPDEEAPPTFFNPAYN